MTPKKCIVCTIKPSIVKITPHDTNLPYYSIVCDCGLHVEEMTLEKAINKWNMLELNDVLEIY